MQTYNAQKVKHAWIEVAVFFTFYVIGLVIKRFLGE